MARPRLAAGMAPPAGAYDADIIILVLNRFDATLAAVKSARAQKDVFAYIALLDQGSDAAHRARFAAAFNPAPRLGYFVSATNLGVGGGRNFLANLGHGRIIIGLDNDAVFADDGVAARSVARFAAERRLGAIGYGILNGDGTAPDHHSWGYPAALKKQHAGRFTTTTFVGAGHAIRRAAWSDAGGYDETLFFTWEEYDFSLRAIARGWRVEYDGTLRVRHGLAAEGRMRWDAARTRLFIRNRIVIARKWQISWLALAPRILAYLVKGAWQGRLIATIAGLAQSIRTPIATAPMPPALRDYLRQHEHRHRGSLWYRLRHEVFEKARIDQ